MKNGNSIPRGSAGVVLLIALISVAVLFGAVGLVSIRGRADSSGSLITHFVERGEFIHVVTERGEIESSRNIEVRCEVKGLNSAGTAILEVVDEGVRVQPGDILVKLDSSALETDLVTQQIACNASESLMIQARNEFEAATIAKKEYLEGTFLQEEQTLQGAVFVAEETLRRAQQYLNYSERLAAKGYVTELQLEGDRFAVEKAVNEMDAAKTKLRVLQEYTKPKMVKDLESKIGSADAKFKAEQSSFQLEMTKLQHIKDQIAKCIIRAPAAGQVVHANEEGRRSENEFVVEPGATVRERQVIIRLPDPTAMQVKAKINESNITLVKVGMPVTIRLDAFGDQSLRGEVTRVNEYPEPSGWFSSQVKEYATEIVIFESPPEIRPGLTASVEILVERKDDVVTAPVQAIHEHGGKYYCMVQSKDGWEAREVSISSSNDKFVVIDVGLDERASIAMDPRKVLAHVQLPEIEHGSDELPTAIVRTIPDSAQKSPGGLAENTASHKFEPTQLTALRHEPSTSSDGPTDLQAVPASESLPVSVHDPAKLDETPTPECEGLAAANTPVECRETHEQSSDRGSKGTSE